jgi:hypothetical protein
VKDVPANPASEQPPQWLDQLRRCIRDKHYSVRIERIYVYWAIWYIRLHGLRHPMQMGVPEIRTFLAYLANDGNVSVSTHHQALCALFFLYKNVLQIELPWFEEGARRLPAAGADDCMARPGTGASSQNWEAQPVNPGEIALIEIPGEILLARGGTGGADRLQVGKDVG